MTITKDLIGKSHTIVRCSLEDIKNHYSKISDVIPELEKEEFCLRMSECVEQGTAFANDRGTCFIYYAKDITQPKFSYGVALYGKGNPLAMLALFAYVFTEIDPEVFVMRLLPHSSSFVKECRSLITAKAIQKNRMTGHPLMIRIDKVKTRVNKILKKKVP